MNRYMVLHGCLVHGWRALGHPCPSCAEADEKARQPERVSACGGGQLGFWHKGRLPTQAVLLLVMASQSACQTTRYVTVPCITKDQHLPAEPPKIHDKLTGEADKDIRTVAGSNIRLRAWGEGLMGILEGCRG